MATKLVLSELLESSRAKLADENNWCKRNLAKDKSGYGIDVNDKNAVQWCALGAIYNVAFQMNVSRRTVFQLEKILSSIARAEALKKNKVADHLVNYNDDFATHQDILDLYDKGLQKIKKGELR